MSVQLKRTEPLTRALRHACQQHAQQALTGLEQNHTPEAIHHVRKEIKRMRALFQLTRGNLRRTAYRKTARMMRLTAKPLAALREALVTQKVFAALTGPQASQFPQVRAALAGTIRQAKHSMQSHDSLTLARFLLKQVRNRLSDLEVKPADWAEIHSQLKKSYSRGRQAAHQAMNHPSPESFHTWRKRVKNLGYQLDFLCPHWPSATQKMLAGLVQLGEQLGDEHDLVLLAQFAQEQCAPSPEIQELQQRIAARREAYREKIHQLGVPLYALPAKAVGNQWEQDWKAWRKR